MVERMRRNGATIDETAAAVGSHQRQSALTVGGTSRTAKHRARTSPAGDSSIEWYTPPTIVEAARSAMGRIDCDPASCDQAQTVVQASVYYTAETDGAYIRDLTGGVAPPCQRVTGVSYGEG